MQKKIKIKQLTLRIPETLHRELKITAVKKGRTMGDLTVELIREYIKRAADPL